jgi:hypothetical protein
MAINQSYVIESIAQIIYFIFNHTYNQFYLATMDAFCTMGKILNQD